ncbi:MAG: DUF4838 domain-containing protein [Kiritimatiellae bacterium]|nr:DUF4838 domain-containing protein [Kiritimatiellia bacterium]
MKKLMTIVAAAALSLGMKSVPMEQITLIDKGQPLVKIYLPAVTELDKFAATSENDPEVRENMRKRFPKASEEEITSFVARYPQFRDWEIQRCGDEEKLAAQELADHLKKISGADVEIAAWDANAAELPPAPAIMIGAEFARRAEFGETLDTLEKDGLLIGVRGGRLYLSGRRARGTLYAVYEYLEQLGVRWFMPSVDDSGTFIPALEEVSASGIFVSNPSHSQRSWWCTYGNGAEYPVWALRNKGNIKKALCDADIAQGHHLATAIQASGEQDESCYGMTDGHINGMVPNMSNPKVWDIYARHYVGEFKSWPYGDYASISAEDALMNDERPESRLLDSNEFDPFMGSPSATDRMWFFHSRYLDKVLEECPGRRFGCLVYSNNLTPPRISHVHPAMALVFAPLGISPNFPVGDPRSPDNIAYKSWFESWMGQATAAGAETYYYDYEPLGFSWNKAMICPRWPIIGQNYRYFWQQGLTGHTTQGWDDWGACHLDHWMMIRLYWNADQDWRDIVADYCSRRFLEAGEAMREYYAVYEKRMAEIPEFTGNEIWGNHLMIPPNVRAAARKCLEKAEAAAKSDWARKQVAIARELQDSTDYFCDGIEYASETGDYAKAATEYFQKSFDIIEASHARYSHAMNPRAGRAGDIYFEPGGWYNKYIQFSEKINGAAASVILPRYWKTVLDTDNLATTRDRLQDPAVSVKDLEDWDITIVPDVKYQTQHQVSAFFQRCEVKVPGSFAGKRARIYFPSIIARAVQIWVNGKSVMFDHGNYVDDIWRGPNYFWYDYNHQREFDLADMLVPGEKNTIAIRIFKSYDHAGSYDRPFLLAD